MFVLPCFFSNLFEETAPSSQDSRTALAKLSGHFYLDGTVVLRTVGDVLEVRTGKSAT